MSTATPIVGRPAAACMAAGLRTLTDLLGADRVDMREMDAIGRPSLEDLDVVVQAGVTRRALDARLRPEGVFFAVDPGADATIGGMVATGASGTTTVRYGAMRENVLALTVVNAYGEVLRTHSRARKSSAVCVPISALADCIAAAQADIAEHRLTASIVGHVGDGNFHVCVLVDPDDAEDIERAEQFHARLVQRALADDGTCTGEHGVGYGKTRFLVSEHGHAGVEMMRAIKHALDPNGIFNPGKVAA